MPLGKPLRQAYYLEISDSHQRRCIITVHFRPQLFVRIWFNKLSTSFQAHQINRETPVENAGEGQKQAVSTG